MGSIAKSPHTPGADPLSDEHEARAGLAIEAANLGTWDLDPQSGALVWDERTRSLAGLGPNDEANYEVFLRTIHPEDRGRVQQAIEAALRPESGGDYRTEYRCIGLRDEIERWLLVRGKVFFDEERATRFIGIVMDISQQKWDEQALKRITQELARSNEDLEQLGWILVHDLKEPLRMVTSFLSLIKHRGLVNSQEGCEFLNFAMGGAVRMKELIEALYRYSLVSRSRVQFAIVNCASILENVLAVMRATIEERRAEITHGPLPHVKGDPPLLGQVFQNLLSNAIEYAGDGPPKVHISAERCGDEWVFSVTDNGIGFPMKDAERIFLIFQRVHDPKQHQGAGAGLAICKRAVERLGGRIWARSEVGKGSTFSFSLPA